MEENTRRGGRPRDGGKNRGVLKVVCVLLVKECIPENFPSQWFFSKSMTPPSPWQKD